MEKIKAYHLSVFPYSPTTTNTTKSQGGNPTTIYLGNPTATQMHSLAKSNTHECGFVLTNGPTTPDHDDCHLAMRYWVPNHEMEMCGHATVGAIWLLNELGQLPPSTSGNGTEFRISTKSGIVDARVLRRQGKGDGKESKATRVLVSQPRGIVQDLPSSPDDPNGLKILRSIVAALGLDLTDLDQDQDLSGLKVQNASTSRTKTLIPLRNLETLASITPNQDSIRAICENIGSTGLYPYALVDVKEQIVMARQFPKSSGYMEDPATGIAAAALAFGLLDAGVLAHVRRSVFVWQGWKMGRPSEIEVVFRWEGEEEEEKGSGGIVGCWISGSVEWLDVDTAGF
ncbi:hypothetical protein N7509_010178 [Penicillium cosmopolitanum]|uniref:Phenazine biosynthesis protein n=1 Tax=Penicillium cosmopolitanum TaxID=1131564 RepID=A0A9X0B4C5_9EURO|nr:uncharacterized protein N7509_010178 [Penicillium cosmopolitanum]KAJ5387637.1 hypothetical protein N7509_010178 [Penicillium cosmopolitanum]